MADSALIKAQRREAMAKARSVLEQRRAERRQNAPQSRQEPARATIPPDPMPDPRTLYRQAKECPKRKARMRALAQEALAAIQRMDEAEERRRKGGRPRRSA